MDYFNGQIDPIKFIKWLWPDISLYKEQRQIVYSVWHNDLTAVTAGHTLGKDYITGLICVAFFLTRQPCRIVTTSVDAGQLEVVLWGEIKRFINTARYPLTSDRGGPLHVKHMHIRQVDKDKRFVDRTYLIGRTADRGEGLSGHHIERRPDGIPRTLSVADECSGIDDESLTKPSEWAHRTLWIGNPYQCNNPFKWAIKGRPGTEDRGGDIPRDGEPGFMRKVLKIRAADSPNVKLAMAEAEAGEKPSHTILIPGVLTYTDYLIRLKTWDDVKKSVGLDAEFFEGVQSLLFPPDWLDRAERTHDNLLRHGVVRPHAKAGGADPGEGRADTCLAAVDDLGLLELKELREVGDANRIVAETIAFIEKWKIPPEQFNFDRGGGGRQIADFLRARGYPVQTIAFGSGVGRPGDDADRRRKLQKKRDRGAVGEDRGVWKNRRSQMYGEFSEILDPHNLTRGQNSRLPFAIPRQYGELRRQLSPIPRLLDGEGKLYLPSKHKKNPNSTEETMEDLIGRSPDHADAVVLAVHALLHPNRRGMAGVLDWDRTAASDANSRNKLTDGSDYRDVRDFGRMRRLILDD